MKHYFVDILDGDITHLNTVQEGLASAEDAFSEACNGLAQLAMQKIQDLKPCSITARVRDEQDRFLCNFNIMIAITKSCYCPGSPPDSFQALAVEYADPDTMKLTDRT